MNAILMEEVCFFVPAQLDACAVIRERVNEFARSLPFNDSDLDDIRLAVGEAASNAVKHGCKGLSDAQVAVRCWTSNSELGIEVEDYGCGFDPGLICDPNFSHLPEGGMGIFYMRCSMDNVKFNFDGGTRVTLIKKFCNGH